jgi:hypothetical protein
MVYYNINNTEFCIGLLAMYSRDVIITKYRDR